MAGNQRRDIGHQQCKVFMRPLAKLRRSGMSVEVGTGIKKASNGGAERVGFFEKTGVCLYLLYLILSSCIFFQ